MSIFQRLWDALGLGLPIDESEYEEYAEEPSATDWQGEYPSRKSLATNVVGMPGWGSSQTEVVLMEPRSFEEVPQVVSALKQRKTVILNLSLMDADTAQRCVDFVAGGVFAIDGHQERVGETVFLFTPSVVQVTTMASGMASGGAGTVAPPAKPSVESSVMPRRLTAPARPQPTEETQNIL